MAKHIPWTPADDEYLRKNWVKKLVSDLEKELGRKRGSILRRARALGLGKKSDWSFEEETYLEHLLPVYGVEHCASHLKRSKESVRVKAKRLGIRIPSKYHNDYSQEEDALLRVISKLPSLTYPRCSEILERGPEGLRKRAKSLGAPTDSDYRTALELLKEKSSVDILSTSEIELLETLGS